MATVIPPTCPKCFLQHPKCSFAVWLGHSSQQEVQVTSLLLGFVLVLWLALISRMWQKTGWGTAELWLQVAAATILTLSTADEVWDSVLKVRDLLERETRPHPAPIPDWSHFRLSHFCWTISSQKTSGRTAELSQAHISNPQNGELITDCGFKPLRFEVIYSIEADNWWPHSHSQVCQAWS